MGLMKKAALYARVSTDAQEKEGTIESQLFELRRQIDAAGDVLVKEYIDDGISGKLLDRPVLFVLTALGANARSVVPVFDAADRWWRLTASHSGRTGLYPNLPADPLDGAGYIFYQLFELQHRGADVVCNKKFCDSQLRHSELAK
jgi:hypothetical protein